MDGCQIRELIELLGKRYSRMRLVIPIPDGPSDEVVEAEIIGLKNLGYHVYIHIGINGPELVITDKS